MVSSSVAGVVDGVGAGTAEQKVNGTGTWTLVFATGANGVDEEGPAEGWMAAENCGCDRKGD